MRHQQLLPEARFLATDTVSIAGGGHMLMVEKGREYTLKRKMFDDALAKGLTPLQDLQIADAAAGGKRDTRTLDDKLELLVEVCERLIIEGAAQNFTQLLKPKVNVVRAMVDFDFTKQTMLRAYDEAIFRTEQLATVDDTEQEDNGNDSTEHSGQAERPAP